MPRWHLWLVAALWLAWEIYWGFAARGVKRAAAREPLPSRLLVMAALLLAFVFLLLPQWFGAAFEQPFLPQSDAVFFAGFTLQLGGFVLALWARTVLGRNWSGRVTIKEDHELVTSGPYRLLRHPIYTGLLLAVTGSCVALGRTGGLAALALILGLCVYKLHLEERMLTQHFGAAYTDYKRNSYALIPGVW